MDVLVVGGGVIGLTTAIRLRETGADVTVMAADYPPHTTSNTAAAVWFPFQAGMDDRIPGWAAKTLEVYYDLAAQPDCGVHIEPGIELFHDVVPDPWWRSCVRVFRPAEPSELPTGYAYGLILEAPIVETATFLQWLLDRCHRMGIVLRKARIQSLADALAICPRVFNCTGLGAKELCRDESMYANRGQVVSVTKPNTTRFCFDQTTKPPTYMIPRSADCILGGSADRDQWSLDPDPVLKDDIIDRCCRLDPSLRSATLNTTWAGLRPGRPTVRLELEWFGEPRCVVHNYGHGGSGFTLAWGCADDAVRLWHAGERRA
jgi:D-amino-acid oxidase